MPSCFKSTLYKTWYVTLISCDKSDFQKAEVGEGLWPCSHHQTTSLLIRTEVSELITEGRQRWVKLSGRLWEKKWAQIIFFTLLCFCCFFSLESERRLLINCITAACIFRRGASLLMLPLAVNYTIPLWLFDICRASSGSKRQLFSPLAGFVPQSFFK